MNKAGVPYGGIALTAAVTLLGVGPERRRSGGGLRDRAERRLAGHHRQLGHDRAVPDQAGQLGTAGTAPAPAFRMLGAPYTGYLTLAFLLACWC